MMVRRFIGHCVLVVSGTLGLTAQGEPVTELSEPLERLLESTTLGWVSGPWSESLVLDENIFTDVSPLLDSKEPVKLPEDQQLAD